MTEVNVTRMIDAAPAAVFAALSDVEGLPTVFPVVVRVEFLSDTRSGVGTRFREVRLMKGKESETELEVTEYDSPSHVRMVADSHGTVWDSIFTVRAAGRRTQVVINMEARAHKLLPRLLNPLMRRLFAKGVADHADALKIYCERAPSNH